MSRMLRSLPSIFNGLRGLPAPPRDMRATWQPQPLPQIPASPTAPSRRAGVNRRTVIQARKQLVHSAPVGQPAASEPAKRVGGDGIARRAPQCRRAWTDPASANEFIVDSSCVRGCNRTRQPSESG